MKNHHTEIHHVGSNEFGHNCVIGGQIKGEILNERWKNAEGWVLGI